MKNCEMCENEHDGKFGSGRFCCNKCAKGYSGKKSKGTDKSWKRAKSNEKIIKKCKFCNEKMILSFGERYKECCSLKCSSKYRMSKKEVIDKINETKRKNNSNSGWNVRYKNKQSYAEKFIEKFLKNNNIFENVEVEHKIKKSVLGLECSANYFLDFYFIDKKIDLEVDGKQHEYPERLEADKIRDKALKDNGYKVYRIKWKSINDDEGKKYIKTELDKFLQFYKDN